MTDVKIPTRPALYLATAVLALWLTPAWSEPAEKPERDSAVHTTQAIDRVLVIVNDDVITESELNNRLQDVRKRLGGKNVQVPPEQVLKKQILEHLILEHLQLQLADQAGIKADPEKLQQSLQGIAQQNHLSLEQLKQKIKSEGIEWDEFRHQIQTQITIQQLLEEEIHNRVVVTESEVENFLSAQEKQEQDVEYNLSHILISLPEKATPQAIQAAKQRAENLWKILRQGADFSQTAIAHSQGQNNLEGGGLGWKKPGQLPSLFLSTLKKMQPGEISDILRSANGFHILRLNEKRGGTAAQAVTQSRVRHILIRTNELVSQQEANRRLLQLRNRLENGEDFAILARSHSEDPGSASNGGELGWVNPGQTVPEFEKTVNTLGLHQLSMPVRTPFGMHLIEVLERRNQDISHERDVASARQQIHARKADERYEQWIRQLRDEAYVDYRVQL